MPDKTLEDAIESLRESLDLSLANLDKGAHYELAMLRYGNLCGKAVNLIEAWDKARSISKSGKIEIETP